MRKKEKEKCKYNRKRKMEKKKEKDKEFYNSINLFVLFVSLEQPGGASEGPGADSRLIYTCSTKVAHTPGAQPTESSVNLHSTD